MSPIRKKDVERFILSDDYKPMVLKELYKKFRAKTREERRKVREVVKSWKKREGSSGTAGEGTENSAKISK